MSTLLYSLQKSGVEVSSTTTTAGFKKHCLCKFAKKKLKQALRKVRTVSKDKQANNRAISKFLNSDQRRLLGKVTSSNRGSKWSQNTVKKALQLHFSCGPTGYNMLLSHCHLKNPVPNFSPAATGSTAIYFMFWLHK